MVTEIWVQTNTHRHTYFLGGWGGGGEPQNVPLYMQARVSGPYPPAFKYMCKHVIHYNSWDLKYDKKRSVMII